MTPFAEEIRRHRATGRDVPIYAYAALDSTNEEAFRLADRESLPEGTAIIADAQTRGKGRTGRSWSSPPGAGLYLSVVYRPPGPAATAPLLTLVAGVAAAAALERLAGRAPRLKWPNDLRYDGRKAGGILTEARAAPDGISLAVVGIGVNLFQQPEDFPPDIRRTATSVAAATGRRVDRAEAAAAVLDELDAGYRRWLREGFGPVARAWRERASTLGKRVRIIRDGAEVEGRAGDLAEDGALLVETASGTVRVQAGEVAELEETECSS